MPNNVTLIKGAGGLGRPLAGEDYISGYIHYTSVLPSGFGSATASRIKQVFSVADAEGYGITSTITTTSGGTASDLDVMHYHISEYFRAQPGGNLFVGVFGTGSTDFSEITIMQNLADGKIRQVGIYKPSTTFATSQCADIQTQLNLCYTNHKPLEAIYQAHFTSSTDLTSLSDLHALTAPNVSVCIGQDGANLGSVLYSTFGKSVGCVGITLGAVSKSAVNESIAWVSRFNMATSELDTLAFANGQLYSALSDGSIDAIDGKGYVFLKKHVGINGSYFDNPYTCASTTSDYCRIPNNRTINKAVRSLRSLLLPSMASPLLVNSDGTLSEDTIAYFNSLCHQALDVMVRNYELSAFGVTINPAQNVLSTSELIINVKLVPVGTADIITVNIGFATSI